MSQQGLRQASARAISGSTVDAPYNEDFMRMFTAEGIPEAGTFNERFLLWLNYRLSRTYTNLPEAMTAFAVSLGLSSWDAVGTFYPDRTIYQRDAAPILDRAGAYIEVRA